MNLATVSDVKLSDLASVEARRRRSLKLGADSGLEDEQLDAFCDRMEEAWRWQQLRRGAELTELERAEDETLAGLRRRAGALIADLLDQLDPMDAAA